MNRVVAEKINLGMGPFPSPSKHYKKTRECVNEDNLILMLFVILGMSIMKGKSIQN